MEGATKNPRLLTSSDQFRQFIAFLYIFSLLSAIRGEVCYNKFSAVWKFLQ